MKRMGAVLFLLMSAIVAEGAVGDARAARLGYSKASCLDAALPAAEAASACTAALRKVKGAAALFIRRGAAFGELGAFDYAIGDFSRAMALAPDSALPLRLRGLVYEMQGRVEESLADYRRLQLLGFDPDVEAAIGRLASTKSASASAIEVPSQNPAPARGEPALKPKALPVRSIVRGDAADTWMLLPVAGLIGAGATLIYWRIRRRGDALAA